MTALRSILSLVMLTATGILPRCMSRQIAKCLGKQGLDTNT